MHSIIETLINSDVEPLLEAIKWVQNAKNAGIKDYNAMCVATVDKTGQPNARMLLLKGLDERGFVFYTNMNSAKGREMLDNPKAAVNFYWPHFDGEYGRCLRARGVLEKVSDEESDAYFNSRSRGSRIASIASNQSAPLASREELVLRVKALQEQYGDDDENGEPVPRPEHWYGHRLIPNYIEFWADGEFRLHDRAAFSRLDESTDWAKQRLNP